MNTYISEPADRIRAEILADDLPSGDTRPLFLLYAVLARAKGTGVTRKDIHDAWVAWMAGRGAEHESMVPFDRLPAEIQAEDGPFVAAIRRALAKS